MNQLPTMLNVRGQRNTIIWTVWMNATEIDINIYMGFGISSQPCLTWIMVDICTLQYIFDLSKLEISCLYFCETNQYLQFFSPKQKLHSHHTLIALCRPAYTLSVHSCQKEMVRSIKQSLSITQLYACS